MRIPRKLALLATSILAVALTAGARPVSAPPAPTGQQTLTDHIDRMCDLWEKGDWEAAGEEFRTIMKLFPHGEEEVRRLEPRRKADFYFVFATEIGKGGQEAEAVSILGEGLRLKPGDALAYYFLGVYAEGNDQKVKALSEAIRLKPDFADAYCLRSVCLTKNADIKGATTDLETAMRLNPRKAFEYSESLASALQAKGGLAGAISLMREAARATPADLRPHEMLVSLFEVKPDWDSAMAEAREWVRLKPDDPDAHAYLGRALARKRDLNGGIAELREAIRLDPDVPRYHSDLAHALGWKGDALGAYQQDAIARELSLKKSHIQKSPPR